MRLQLNRVLAPITVLGPGRRVGVWVQGCTLACTGCASTDTWASDGGLDTTTDSVAEQVLAVAERLDLTGVTVTGGEPFQQADAVTDLLVRIRRRRADLDVLVFTGYTLGVAARRSPGLLEAADAVVAGRYRPELPDGGPLRASANQELVVRTELGRRRFAGLDGSSEAAHEVVGRRLQVTADDGSLFLVGLPASGDLERLGAALEERGVSLSGVSWRP